MHRHVQISLLVYILNVLSYRKLKRFVIKLNVVNAFIWQFICFRDFKDILSEGGNKENVSYD